MHFKNTIYLLATSSLLITSSVTAQQTPLQACVMSTFNSGDENLTLKELRQLCNKDILLKAKFDEISVSKNKNVNLGAISRRILTEKETEFEPYVITPHRINYILPAYSSNAVNTKPYQSFDEYPENLSDIETHFQLSLKVPLNHESLFIDGDGLYLGFTLQAWWQIYASNISKPFRETNYQPEMFYLAPLTLHPFDGNTGFMLGVEHQSNGKSQGLSRSWNRAYLAFLFEKNNFALSFKPWYRFSEKEKEFPLDPNGDDNPDISDYMGHFELAMVYKWDDVELSFTGRQNFSKNKGAAQFGITFPLWGKLRGYATAFSGYGDSLIDYNYSQTRFGIGVALSNIL